MNIIPTDRTPKSSCFNTPMQTPTIMRPVRRLTNLRNIALGAILSTVASHGVAQTWQTIDDMSPNATAQAIATDSVGNLFVAGYAKDAAGVYHFPVLKSNDQGATWDSDLSTPEIEEPADDFTTADLQTYSIILKSARVLTAGGAYEDHIVRGVFIKNTQGARFVIRRSTDGGTHWVPLDFSPSNSNHVLSFAGLTVVPNGDIYVSYSATETLVTYKGKTATTTTVEHKAVSRFDSASGSWQTAATWPGSFFAGSDSYTIQGGDTAWYVRKSVDRGLSWNVVDTYRYDATTTLMTPTGIAADNHGNVYVAGYGRRDYTVGTGKSATRYSQMKWLVRKGANRGTNWSTIGAFGERQYVHNMARGIAVDSSDNVYVAGFDASEAPSRWVTRKFTAATSAWSISDDFRLVSGHYSEGRQLATGPWGGVFAIGSSFDVNGTGTGGSNWIVRKLLP
jgi:hypothetical protein